MLFIVSKWSFPFNWSINQTRFALSFLICSNVLNTRSWQTHPSPGPIILIVDRFIRLRFFFLTENATVIISACSSCNLYSSRNWLRVNDAVCFIITFNIRSSWINLDIEGIFKLLLVNLSLLLKASLDVLRSTLCSSITARSCSLLLLGRRCG